MKNNYQVVAIDLDGTLLPKTKEITKETIDYLVSLQEKGIHVIIATGRNPKETFEISKELRCVDFNGHMICCNGQLIHCYGEGEDLESERLHQKDAIEIARIGIKHHVMVSIDNDEGLYQSKNFQGWFHLLQRVSKSIRNTKWVFNQLKSRHIHRIDHIEDAINKDIRKICFAGSNTNLKRLAKEIKDVYQERVDLMFVAETWLEVMVAGVSKGNALKKVSELLNIPLSQFIAFGDGENDLSMIQIAGHGVAMQNAMPSVKAVADDIAGSNDDDGVMKYLKNLGM